MYACFLRNTYFGLDCVNLLMNYASDISHTFNVTMLRLVTMMWNVSGVEQY